MSLMKKRLPFDVPVGTYSWGREQLSVLWEPDLHGKHGAAEVEEDRPAPEDWSRADVYLFVTDHVETELTESVGSFKFAAEAAEKEARIVELTDLVKRRDADDEELARLIIVDG